MTGSLDAGFTASPPSILSKALQTAVLCPTFVVNLLGNISVCLAITHVRSLNQRPTSSLLASLAVCDLSMLMFILFRLVWLYDLEAASKVCEFFFVLLSTLCYVSIAHICLLSCDRYFAIVYPLRYADIFTKTRVWGALVVAWGVPVLSMLVVPLTYSNEKRTSYRTSLIGCLDSESPPTMSHRLHLTFNIIVFVAIPFAVTVFVYSCIAKIAWCQNNRVEPGENLNPEMIELKRNRRKQMKWLRTIVMVIGAFILCYLPAFTCLVFTAKLGATRVPIQLRSILVLLVALNSAINPVIYMLRSNEFKHAFWKVFRRASTVPQIKDTSWPTGTFHTELTPRSPPLNQRIPSFLALPNVRAPFQVR